MQTQSAFLQIEKATSTRRITVCRKTCERPASRRNVHFPILNLCGKWLQDSGFKIGHVVDIACENGKLTITLADEQRYIDK